MVTSSPISVEPPRVLDQTALEKRLAGEVGGLKKDNSGDYVACPLSVVVKEGTKFDCRVYGDTNPETVYVEITSDQGDVSVSSNG
ncbi:DUF4333 domain-containing protein [Streptomyces sp. NPDC059718]